LTHRVFLLVAKSVKIPPEFFNRAILIVHAAACKSNFVEYDKRFFNSDVLLSERWDDLLYPKGRNRT
jgi:hypothetical protein